MKPLQLKMQAFGSFAEETVINFADFHGTFLITGDTGAGKTTLFDAICFALFGEASGSEGRGRDKAALRSDYAAPEDETWVELTFQLRGEVYCVRRNPDYERPKLRGTGTTTTPAKATLWQGEKVLSTKFADATRQIVSLLGVDVKQFRQIAMIAQGEFMTILRAESSDRSKLFRDLFGTAHYENFQRSLKDQYLAMRRDMALEERSIRDLAASITGEAAEAAAQFAATTGLDGIENVFNALTAANQRAEAQCAAERDALRPLAEAVRTTTAQLTAGKIYHEKFNRLRACNAALTEAASHQAETEQQRTALRHSETALHVLRPLYEKRQEALNQVRIWHAKGEAAAQKGVSAAASLEKAQRQETELNVKREKYLVFVQQQNALEGQLPQYDQLERLTTSAQKSTMELANLDKQLAALTAKQNEATAQQTALDAEAVQLPQRMAAHSDAQFKQNALAQRREWADRWRAQLKKAQSAQALAESAAAAFAMAKSQREQSETKAIALRDVFLQAQAGILAAEALHPGQPCPVCGSVHHPAPAPLAEHVPSREQVELAEQAAERMRGTEREASQRSGEAGAAWTQARQQAEETRQLLDWQGDYAALDAALTAQEQDIMQALIRCTQQVRSAEQAQQTLQQVKEQLAQFSRQQEALRERQSALRSEADKAQSARDILAEQLTHPTKEAALAALALLRKNIQAYEKREAEVKATRELALKQAESARKEAQMATEEETAAQQNAQAQEQQWHDALVREDFADEAAYQAACPASEAVLQARQAQLKAQEERLRALRQEQESLQAELAEREDTPLEQLTQAYEAAAARLAQAQQALSELEHHLAENQRRQQLLSTRMAANRVQREALERMKRLSDVANGDDASKLTFEVYLQRTWFSQVIERANLHMNQLTGGVLLLTLKEPTPGQQKTGLDLNVFDAATGRERSAATLSGGESFKASLSLALGMSELIGEIAGGVELDSMFIDEGFGTLDDASLNQALDVLSTLSLGQRLVGIISHRPELRERIPQQIEVVKTSTGSSVTVK